MADKKIKWQLHAPNDCFGVLMPDNYSDVIVANDAGSDFGVDVYINDSQIGHFGPSTKERYGLAPGKEMIQVKTGINTHGQATGSFTFTN